MGALGIFLRRGRDRGHLAVLALAAQPTKKRAFQALSVEPVGLGASVLARYRNACCMNDMDLDRALSANALARSRPGRPQRRPQHDRSCAWPSPLLLAIPQAVSKVCFIQPGLFQRLAFHARYDPGDEPAILLELQNSDIMLGITKQPSTPASIPSREWFSA